MLEGIISILKAIGAAIGYVVIVAGSFINAIINFINNLL